MQERLRLSVRVATGILFAWIISFPVSVNALGFGNINIKSALNEPLVAEIELLSATSDDVKNLTVKLASREAFLRAGVDRSVILTRIRFDVVKRGGKYYINLRTQETIREPFLNFLLEMNWKNGRMLREYTVLLDPPERRQEQRVAQAPETAPAETAPAPSPLAEPEPMPAPEPLAAAPALEPEPMPAPEPMAAPESPFLDTPAPESAPAADEPLFPQVALDSEPQVPAEGPDAVASAEPAPEPVAAPELIEAPEPTPLPDTAAAPEPLAEPEPMPAPEVVAAPEPLAEPEAAFQEEGDGLFPQTAIQPYSETDKAAAPEPIDVAEAPVAAPEETYTPVGELDYGITRKGDTAWNIAQKLRPSDQISVYQVMMALQQSNPSAFINNNIHRLKTGQVLRIDDASLLTAMSKEQAAEQYQLQTGAWEEYLASVGAQVPRQAIVAGDAGADAAPAETGGELTLATPTGDDQTAAGGAAAGASSEDTALLREQVRQAMAEATAERNKNAELSAKLDQLEEELKRLENLVTVKDSDLAALQARLEELNQQRAAAGETVTVAEPEPTPEPMPEPTPEPAPAEEIATAEPPAEPAPTAEPEPIEPSPIEPPEAAIEPSPLDPVTAPEQPDAPAPATTSSGGIMDTVMGMFSGLGGIFSGGMTMIIGAVVGVVLLVLLVVVLIRRRKGVNFQESILNGGSAEAGATATATADATPSQDSSLMGGESSFLSDFAISGVSAIQAEDSEVDPLTEADVFMAYGRYEAAEERLQEAINQDPGRGELRVKLLELFNTTKNKQGFETAAEEFYATLGDGASSDPLWHKVVAMGSEIAPGNPLFSGEGMPTMDSDALATPEPSGMAGGDVMDIGLDTGVFSNSELTGGETAASEEAPAVDLGADLDFSLDSGGTTEEPAQAAEADAGLDFSLGSDESSTEISMPTEDEINLDLGGSDESTEAGASDEGLEFSMDSSAEDSGGELDFNLDLGGDEETATDIKLDMAEESAPELSSGLDFDLNSEEQAAAAESSSDMLDLESAAGGDEVGTKLDLARAYIDMGDPDGARSILDEVIDEGDDGQKQEAQQLMAQLG